MQVIQKNESPKLKKNSFVNDTQETTHDLSKAREIACRQFSSYITCYLYGRPFTKIPTNLRNRGNEVSLLLNGTGRTINEEDYIS